MPRATHSLLLQALVLFLLRLSTELLFTHALVFRPPPSVRLALGQEQSLKNECQEYTREQNASKAHFVWASEIQACDYTLATKIFECLASSNATAASGVRIWLPRLEGGSSNKKRLSRLTQVLTDNSHRLNGVKVEWTTWPKTPATQVRICIQPESLLSSPQQDDCDDRSAATASAIKATERWVREKLCGMALCPYTTSMTRAAVGLESAGVAEGPIVIRHSEEIGGGDDINTVTPAVTLSRAFWKGVTDLAVLTEDEVATFLIIAPNALDNNFVEFASIFDELIEPSVQAVGAEAIVGRAIFHPHYKASLIGHDKVIAGHALPAEMVQKFVEQYAPSITDASSKTVVPSLEVIAEANDAVRWTPHATINLLRRSQLNAAKDLEAASATKKPNWIYAKNVLRMIQSQPIGS